MAKIADVRETITVPDLALGELAELFKEYYFDFKLALWWSYLEESYDKTFEVLVHQLKYGGWDISDARKFQQAVGFNGNIAAFIAWVIVKKPLGMYTTCPNDDNRHWHEPGLLGDLHVPHYRNSYFRREFTIGAVPTAWSNDWLLVTFRAI